MQILDEDQPITALRQFLDDIAGEISVQEGQVALGSAQLMLLPIEREQRGGDEVKALLDLMIARWPALPERTGFHAQGFLRNAFAAVGDDPERIAQLHALVPADPSPELQYNIASAYAYVGDKPAMLAALRVAIESGATAAQVRRDNDFIAFADDADLAALLDGIDAGVIPVDVVPQIAPIRAALHSLVATLRGLGEHGVLHPPATLESVLSAERAAKIQLPNDFRALLTIADGCKLWENEFFGTADYRTETPLAQRARAYLALAARGGLPGLDTCIPLANCGQPTDWLLYDPRGAVRGGAPGYVLMLDTDDLPIDDLVAALERIEQVASDVLGTN